MLRPLEPAPVQALAREFMVKTRRRKVIVHSVYACALHLYLLDLLARYLYLCILFAHTQTT